MSYAALIVAAWVGCVVGVAIMALLSYNRSGDTDILDTLEANEWHISNSEGLWAVMQGRVHGGMVMIGTPASSLRGAVLQASEVLEGPQNG